MCNIKIPEMLILRVSSFHLHEGQANIQHVSLFWPFMYSNQNKRASGPITSQVVFFFKLVIEVSRPTATLCEVTCFLGSITSIDIVLF